MIGRTYERLAFSDRESPGSSRSNTAVPVYTTKERRWRRARVPPCCATLAAMTDYALLLLPSANRVYTDAAVELTLAELEIFGSVLDAPLSELAPATIAGVGYVTFTTDSLSARDLSYLGNASAAYALFERQGPLLLPLPLAPLDRFDDDLLTIQKYAGKTNEQFTKLLLNVTLLARADPGALLDGRLRVLDPLCGRGTTLNQVLMYGHDAAGVDLDAKDYEAYQGFLRTYLQRKRIKHRIEEGP